MLTLCVDAGTTLIKTVAYDDAGRDVAVARREVGVSTPRPGFSEQDMGQVWAAVAATLREATAADGQDVGLIAFTGQGDGCWLVDGDGRPTGPAVLWNDARAAAIARRWQQEGRAEQAFRVNGSVGFAGLPHAILTWLAAHDPDRVARSHAALTCDGWLFACLTGEIAIDESDAAAPWLDVARRDYSPEILELYGLGWARRLLPALRNDGDRVAPLRAEAAEQLGVRAGVPVVMAPYDLAATSIGAGAVAGSQATSILGTTLSTQVVTDAADVSGTPTGLTIPLGVGGHYLRAFPTLAGTQVLTWAAGLLGVEDAAALCALGEAVAPGADGIVFLPYLSPAGERVPFVDAQARGEFAGLSLDHGRDRVARAVLEGLTHVIRECLDVGGTAPTELRVCGGGANSAAWCQLIADVVGVTVIRSGDSEIGTRGALLTALVATGAAPDHAAAAAAHIRVRDTFEPDPARHTVYDRCHEDFLEVRAQAARTWPRLAATRSREPA